MAATSLTFKTGFSPHGGRTPAALAHFLNQMCAAQM